MEIIKYPDGSSYAKMHDYDSPNEFVFRINTYEDLWHLNQVVDAWNHRYDKQPTIIIPNLIDAQADRRFNYDESSGLKLVCKFLNDMDAKFKIFHPHNPEVVEALMDNVKVIDNSEFIKKVLLEVREVIMKPNYSDILYNNNLILMSSDAGGFKPLMKLCDKIEWEGETYSASKSRERYGKTNKLPNSTSIRQLVDREDFQGKDILIIDDISVYGGTFKGLAKLLRERNCGKLYLAVSHMTVQNLGEDPVTNYFDKVFTTDSKYGKYYKGKSNLGIEGMIPKNLEIIKLF